MELWNLRHTIYLDRYCANERNRFFDEMNRRSWAMTIADRVDLDGFEWSPDE